MRLSVRAILTVSFVSFEAQKQAIKVGANPAIYARLFEKIAARRTALQTKRNLVQAFSPTTPQETASFVAEKVERLPEIFTAEDLTIHLMGKTWPPDTINSITIK